jgi:hypothetical protein
MEVLRQADKPMTSRQIALEVLRQSGTENPDKPMIQRTLNAVEASMRSFVGGRSSHLGSTPLNGGASQSQKSTSTFRRTASLTNALPESGYRG